MSKLPAIIAKRNALSVYLLPITFALLVTVASAQDPSATPSASPEPSPGPSPSPSVSIPASAEDLYWQEISKKDTVFWYEMYLREYPKGAYVLAATQRIEYLENKRKAEELDKKKAREEYLWKEAIGSNTKEAYSRYLVEFPDGSHAADVRFKINEIEREESLNAWQEAEKKKDEASYRQYLENFPAGEFRSLARLRLIDLGVPVDEFGQLREGLSRQLQIIYMPKASYTTEARKQGVSGTISLKVTFNADGTIGSIEPQETLCCGLTEQSVAAAKQIRFEPAMRDGIPQTATRVVTYSFRTY